MSEEIAVIANLTAQSWNLHRNYGAFCIRGAEIAPDARAAQAANGASPQMAGDHLREGSPRANGGDAHRVADSSKIANREIGVPGNGSAHVAQAPSLTRVTPRRAVLDMGDKRTMDIHISARDIAADLCREINGDAGEDSFLGAFVCAGDAPTPAELADARRRLDAFYARKVAEADREWARSHSYLFLDDLQRRAARELGLEREWNYQLDERAACPGCGDRVRPNVAVCKSCGAILDRAKARELGLLPAHMSAQSNADASANAAPNAHAAASPAAAQRAATPTPAANAPGANAPIRR